VIPVQFAGSFIVADTTVRLWPVQTPRDAAQALATLGPLVGITGPITPHPDSLIIFKGDGYLEAFSASDSWRWVARRSLPGHLDRPPVLPSEDAASAAALVELERLGYTTDVVPALEVTYEERIPPQEAVTSHRTALHVNVRHTIDGLAVIGPGAKSRVTFDGEGVRGAYRFWHDVAPGPSLPLIPLSAAMSIISQDQAFTNLDDRTSSVTFESVRLCHFAVPPFQRPSHLIPVYEFVGTAVTPTHGDHRLVKHVLAISQMDAAAHGMSSGDSHFATLFLSA